jgi:hypothetical protein
MESWLALLTERRLRRNVHRSTKELKAAIDRFIESHNTDPKPFVWHKTADQILDSVAAFVNELMTQDTSCPAAAERTDGCG